MGGGRDEEVERLVANLVSQSSQALGYHDLRVHDYGAGRKVASAHVDAIHSFALSCGVYIVEGVKVVIR